MIIDYGILATTTLGFSLALTWNEASIKIIKYLYPNVGALSEALEYLIYTIIITCIIIIIVYLSNKFHESSFKLNDIKNTIIH